jgi:hypothetical protein
VSINTVKVAGKCLLLAVRDRLRVRLFAGQENACDIEPDETAHAITGNDYVAVMPGGFQPGPAHPTSGGVNDLIFDVRLLVVRRITHVPKDRTRDAFLLQTGSLDDLVGDVFQEINWKYEVTNAANDKISELAGVSYDFFNHPLVFAGMDSQPEAVHEVIFGGRGDNDRAGLKRTIRFGMARFTDYLRP